MESRDLIKIASRALTAINTGTQPDLSDVQALWSEARPDERNWTLDELASEILKREITKRRTERRR